MPCCREGFLFMELYAAVTLFHLLFENFSLCDVAYVGGV